MPSTTHQYEYRMLPTILSIDAFKLDLGLKRIESKYKIYKRHRSANKHAKAFSVSVYGARILRKIGERKRDTINVKMNAAQNNEVKRHKLTFSSSFNFCYFIQYNQIQKSSSIQRQQTDKTKKKLQSHKCIDFSVLVIISRWVYVPKRNETKSITHSQVKKIPTKDINADSLLH